MNRFDLITRRLDNDRNVVIVLAVIVLAFFLPSLLIPNVLIWPWNNPSESDIPYRHWVDVVGYVESFRAGKIALWDPLSALGRPLAGDVTVLFMYPLNVLFLFFDLPLGFNVFYALHVFMAAVFTFFFLKSGYHLSRPAALVGALTFAFSPKLFAHLTGGHVNIVAGMAWTPAVLLGLKLAFDGNLLFAALAGLALAIALPTHVQIPFLTAAIGSALWVWELSIAVWFLLRGDKTNWLKVRHLIAAYLIWLLAFGLSGAVVLSPLLELLLYHSRNNFSLLDSDLFALPPVMLLSLLVDFNWIYRFQPWTVNIGVIAPVMGLLGWWLSADRKAKWFYGLLTAGTLLYALGNHTPLYGWVYNYMPGFKFLREPPRAWLFGGFAVAVLAALGADLITRDDIQDRIRPYFIRLRLTTIAYTGAGLLGSVLYVVIAREVNWLLTLQVVSVILLAWGVAKWLNGTLSSVALQWALAVLLAIDLLPRAASFIELVTPEEQFLQPSKAFEYINQQPGIFRVYSDDLRLPPYAWMAENKIESLEAGIALQIGHSVDMIRQSTGCHTDLYSSWVPVCLTTGVEVDAVPDAEKLGILNVRYLVTEDTLEDKNFQLVLDSTPAVYENLLWQPRVRVPLNGEAIITQYSAGHYQIAASSPEAAQIIISDTWLPGWQASVDGEPAPVEWHGDGILEIEIGPGEHTVQLDYLPQSWQRGWPISLGAWLALACWVIATVWQRRRQPSASTT